MNIRHIQRGKFRNSDDSGVDGILEFEYMGAAEYEFGALPRSLKFIRENSKFFCIDSISVRDVQFGILWDSRLQNSDKESIQQAIKLLSSYDTAHKVNTKMGACLYGFFEPKEVQQLKRGCKKKTELVRNRRWCSTNFWWDIDNNWMLFPIEYKDIVLDKVISSPELSRENGKGFAAFLRRLFNLGG